MKRLFDLLNLMIERIKACVRTVNGIVPDPNGNVEIAVGGGLPSGGAPHQMLVTDADEKTVWEERTHYEEKTIHATEHIVSVEKPQFKLERALECGKEYDVFFDGVKYICVGEEFDGYIMIGNHAIYEWDNDLTDDNGMPFAIEAEVGEYNCEIYFAEGDTNEHTVSVCVATVDVKTLDVKYMPEQLQIFAEYVVGETVIPSMTVEHNMHEPIWGYCSYFDYEAILEAGKWYAVIFNGKQYNCLAYRTQDAGAEGMITAVGSSVVGDVPNSVPTDNGEPFFYGQWDHGFINMNWTLESGNPVTIEIKEATEIVHPLKEKFIPNTVSRKTLLFSESSCLYFDYDCTKKVTGTDMLRIVNEGVFDIIDLSEDHAIVLPLLINTTATGTVLSGATVEGYIGGGSYKTYTTTDYEAAGAPA